MTIKKINNNKKKETEDRIITNPFSEDDVDVFAEPYEYDYE